MKKIIVALSCILISTSVMAGEDQPSGGLPPIKTVWTTSEALVINGFYCSDINFYNTMLYTAQQFGGVTRISSTSAGEIKLDTRNDKTMFITPGSQCVYIYGYRK